MAKSWKERREEEARILAERQSLEYGWKHERLDGGGRLGTDHLGIQTLLRW